MNCKGVSVLNKAAIFAIIGVVLIIVGTVLNDLAIRIALENYLSYSGPTPPPQPIIVGTVFLALIPLGLISLGYSLFLVYGDFKVK